MDDDRRVLEMFEIVHVEPIRLRQFSVQNVKALNWAAVIAYVECRR